MKKNKAILLKKKQKKAKYLRNKMKSESNFSGPIQISYSSENGDEMILLDRKQEWLESLKK
jgi:hypothetical protein